MEDNHKCLVCGKFNFEEDNSLEICEVCGWQDDAIQTENPNYVGGANKVTLNQAKEAWNKQLSNFR